MTVEMAAGVVMAKKLRKHPEVDEKRDTVPHDTLVL